MLEGVIGAPLKKVICDLRLRLPAHQAIFSRNNQYV